MLCSYDTNKIFFFFSSSTNSVCHGHWVLTVGWRGVTWSNIYLRGFLSLMCLKYCYIHSVVLHSGRTVEVISAPALQQRRPLIQSRMIFLKGIVTWAFFFSLQKFPPLVQNLAGYDCEGMFFFSFSTYMVLWSVFCVPHPHSATRRSDLCQPQQLPSFSCNPKTN